MPKVLLYITARITWTFLFFGTDVNENRAHVHVGKRGTEVFAKIWQFDTSTSKTNNFYCRRKQESVTQTMAELQDRQNCETNQNQ